MDQAVDRDPPRRQLLGAHRSHLTQRSSGQLGKCHLKSLSRGPEQSESKSKSESSASWQHGQVHASGPNRTYPVDDWQTRLIKQAQQWMQWHIPMADAHQLVHEVGSSLNEVRQRIRNRLLQGPRCMRRHPIPHLRRTAKPALQSRDAGAAMAHHYPLASRATIPQHAAIRSGVRPGREGCCMRWIVPWGRRGDGS